jgi:hypothetical protein
MSYLTFTEYPAKGVTKRWTVASKTGVVLGEVKWYSAWRRYIFFPNALTCYDADCLLDIVTFLNSQMQCYRDQRTV